MGKNAAEKRDVFSKTEKALMLLSNETCKGLSITNHSFIAVVRQLLQDPKLKGKYLCSERFSQDPLENVYGRV